MDIPQAHLEEFKRHYKIEFGEDITDETARELLTNLVMLFKRVYSPSPEAKSELPVVE